MIDAPNALSAVSQPLLRRIEERALNVTAPLRQLVYDGWLLRLQPGPTKRGRSVNAALGSSLPVVQKIRHCEQVYARAGLPALFRLTPFDHPRELDAVLAAEGYVAFDETHVQVADINAAPIAHGMRRHTDTHIIVPDLAEFAAAVATVRGATLAQREEYEARLQRTPVGWRGFVATRGDVPVATGQIAYEDEGVVGLFDIITAPSARDTGAGTLLCGVMLEWAWTHGARHAYLQVMADNAPALAVYRKFGFVEGYRYHYRGRAGECE